MNTVTMIINIVLLLFVVGDAAWLYRRRSRSSPPASGRLKKITRWRMIARVCVAAALILLYCLVIKRENPSHLSQTLWMGAYIGFTTNALVTFALLKVFVQKMKSTIASAITDKISELVKAAGSSEGSSDTETRIGGIIGLLAGMFIPGGVLTTILAGILGYTGGGILGYTKEKITEAEIETHMKNIENEIKNMSNDEIADTMDEIIGNLLTVIEVLGLLLGIVFAFLLSV